MSKKFLKILVVDDEPLILQSIKIAGESAGHIVKKAENALIALSLWMDFDPDLVFVDILMPKMNGLEMLKKIPKSSKARIVVISAHDQLSEKDIKNKGVDLFIKKPFVNVFHLITQAEKLIS